MGVIWNPEEISYMLDTHIINFGEFQFWGEGGGEGGKGAPRGGEGRYIAVRQLYQKNKHLPAILSHEIRVFIICARNAISHRTIRNNVKLWFIFIAGCSYMCQGIRFK